MTRSVRLYTATQFEETAPQFAHGGSKLAGRFTPNPKVDLVPRVLSVRSKLALRTAALPCTAQAEPPDRVDTDRQLAYSTAAARRKIERT